MSYGGSTMFLDTTDRVRVEDLLRGIVVLSGNDACVVIAEALWPDGTERGFADLMTRRAQQMGMTNSVFKNANGWPAEGHVMSMRDLAPARQPHHRATFPTSTRCSPSSEFEFDGRAPANVSNRNPLLGLGIGADGLKTGHTQAAGYGLVGSAEQGGRRIIFALTGLESNRARAEESEAIVNWAFRQFAEKQHRRRRHPHRRRRDVWMGAETEVGLVAEDDVTLLCRS